MIGASGKRLSGRPLSQLRSVVSLMVSLDGTGCLEGGLSGFEPGAARDPMCRRGLSTLNMSNLKISTNGDVWIPAQCSKSAEIEQHVRLFRGAMGAEFLFTDNIARPHRENIVDECLQSEDITRRDWPA
ncbi:transposable element Tcb2 transposase [Trichonephila clavipes]|nr:transposable element Tcb2 transposase [Trichonephila clavipes]